MKQSKHWLLTVVLLLCSAAQMSGEIILTQADGLLDGRIKYDDGTTQFYYESPVLSLGEPTNKLVLTMLSGYTEWASPYDHSGFPFMCIAEFTLYDGDGNEIELDASNFSTNAQEPTEGNIVNICDDNDYTFFHSTWSGAVGTYHNITITLPDDMELEEFQFEYYTRKAEFHQLHGIPQIISIGTSNQILKCDRWWKYTNDGSLAIFGTNAVPSRSTEYYWENFRESIKSVTIGYGIERIGVYAFEGFSNLTEVTIPESVIKIDGLAFDGCSNLADVTIPESVMSMPGSAFQGTKWFENLPLGLFYTNDKALLFYKEDMWDWEPKTVVVKEGFEIIGSDCFHGANLASIKLPETLTIIEDAAFCGCSLESIALPKNVREIHQQAFDYCDDLKSIICHAETPPSFVDYEEMGFGFFEQTDKGIPVYVPESSVSLYREHELWGTFTNIQAITEETGVENIRFVGNDAQADEVYDMSGRRITDTENLKKGIYIVNGRKVQLK